MDSKLILEVYEREDGVIDYHYPNGYDASVASISWLMVGFYNSILEHVPESEQNEFEESFKECFWDDFENRYDYSIPVED